MKWKCINSRKLWGRALIIEISVSQFKKKKQKNTTRSFLPFTLIVKWWKNILILLLTSNSSVSTFLTITLTLWEKLRISCGLGAWKIIRNFTVTSERSYISSKQCRTFLESSMLTGIITKCQKHWRLQKDNTRVLQVDGDNQNRRQNSFRLVTSKLHPRGPSVQWH